jgi:hypothetical protein
VYLLVGVGYVSGEEEGKTVSITVVLGENGVIEEVFGEEIRFPMRARHLLETHLNRIRDFGGSHENIFTTISSGR